MARTTNVAANGNRLFFLETNIAGQLSVVITGGTGRFAGGRQGELLPASSEGRAAR